MVASLWLSWQNGVSLVSNEGQAIVAGPGARIALRPLAPEILVALARLAPPGEPEDRLESAILAAGNVNSLARWFYHVDQLRQRGLVCRSLRADGRLTASLVPLCCSLARPAHGVSVDGYSNTGSRRPRAWRSGNGRCSGETSYVLSRFAYLRREDGELVLESPLAHARVILHDSRAVVVIGALAAPATVEELAERLSEMAPGTISAFVDILVEAGMVDQMSPDATRFHEESAQSESGQSESAPSGSFPSGSLQSASNPAENPALGPALDTWEFHDLLFHSRSRRGRSDGRFGGTYRLAGRPPPPALTTNPGRKEYALFRPDLEQLERDDPPLARVQELRRSIRRYGKVPLTARQLGEFLYRVGRVTRHWQTEAQTPCGPVSMDFTARPYPASGGMYELEFYAAIRACGDFEPGLYHYDPQQHRLARVCGPTSDHAALLDDAASSAGIDRDTLQVLIILTARFERIAWKYESIAYSLILKDVGVVYQTMYLAATAMDLAPCALGCGDSDLFARAADTDYFVETSVGEFLLGSIE